METSGATFWLELIKVASAGGAIGQQRHIGVIFKKGQPQKYDGNRQAEGIVSWCEKNSVSLDAPDTPPVKSHVLDMTGADFSHLIDHYQHMLIMFYAPWCGHCKRQNKHPIR